MFTPEITSLLESKIPQLPKLLIAPSLRHDLDDVMAMVCAPGTIAVVDDHDTSHALGDKLCRALSGHYDVIRVALGKAPTPDAKTVNLVRKKAKNAHTIVAVGSGTVNDIVKYASFSDKKPYIIFPTAASMNGYLSANASITIDGYKTTLAAHLPKAVFCDLSVITAAPSRLNKSGLGDSLARPTAQFDWLLSHLLLNTKYDTTPFDITASLEEGLFDSARGLALADPSTVQLLMKVLLLSGLGMTMAEGSYPASQSEHMLAHSFEMLVQNGPIAATLHGEQIGVTTLTAATRQEQMLTRPPTIAATSFPESEIQTHFGKTITTKAHEAFHTKLEQMEESGITDASIKSRWSEIAHKLHPLMVSPARILHILTEAQAPTRFESLGWQATDYAHACKYARYLRERFTCLDLNPG